MFLKTRNLFGDGYQEDAGALEAVLDRQDDVAALEGTLGLSGGRRNPARHQSGGRGHVHQYQDKYEDRQKPEQGRALRGHITKAERFGNRPTMDRAAIFLVTCARLNASRDISYHFLRLIVCFIIVLNI